MSFKRAVMVGILLTVFLVALSVPLKIAMASYTVGLSESLVIPSDKRMREEIKMYFADHPEKQRRALDLFDKTSEEFYENNRGRILREYSGGASGLIGKLMFLCFGFVGLIVLVCIGGNNTPE